MTTRSKIFSQSTITAYQYGVIRDYKNLEKLLVDHKTGQHFTLKETHNSYFCVTLQNIRLMCALWKY